MAWYLAPDLVADRIDWRFEPGEKKPYGYTSPNAAPKDEDFARCYTLHVEDKRRSIPDLAKGPCENMMVVSQAFRRLIQTMDPDTHHFLALRIVLNDGAVLEDTHFWFKLATFTDDALDPEQSTISPMIIGGTLRLYQSKNMTPNLTWKASKVAGRHIWADRLMPGFVVVSDQFYAEMKRLGMRDFISKESRIDPTQ